MDIPTTEVVYTLATTGKGDHKVYKGHVVALAQNKLHLVFFVSCRSGIRPEPIAISDGPIISNPDHSCEWMAE
jgi:hypothetical protein